jgi:hypothetical protein
LKILFYVSIILLFLLISYGSFFLLSDEKVVLLVREDGPVEVMGAIFFLGCSLLFIWLFIQSKHGNDFHFFRTRKNFFWLILGLLFFFAFGEEISWGQRIFHYSTPEIIRDSNIQEELNIHNLKIFHGLDSSGQRKSFVELFLNIDRLFSVFWLLFCLLCPLLAKRSSRISSWFERINLPLVPLWLGIFFLLNYLLSKILELFFTQNIMLSAITEIKETNFALLFFLVSWWFLQKEKERSSLMTHPAT